MIVLEANQTLNAKASVASKIVVTMFGMELNTTSSVETYKMLKQGVLTTALAGFAYTATANGPTFIRAVHISNIDTSDRTFQLMVAGTSAAANEITPAAMTILAGGMATYTDGEGWRFIDSSGRVIMGAATGGTPAIVLGTAAAAGVATTYLRDDDTIVAFDATVPVTQASADAAATGSVAVAARRDHKHGMPTFISSERLASSTTPAAVSTAGAVGTGTTDARDDHVHAHETGHIVHDTIWDTAGDLAVATAADTAAKLALTVPAANILNVLGVVNGETTPTWKAAHDGTDPAAIGTVAVGTSLFTSHRDHVHATGAGTPSTQAFGDAAVIGTGPAASMTDHKHAMPAAPTTIANDTFWAAKGDLAVATANDAAAVVGIGATAGALRVVAGTAAWDTASVATPAAIGTSGAAGTSANPSSHDDHSHAHEPGHVVHDTVWDALGDLVYGSGADTATKLAGQITTTKKYLQQTGDGAVSAAPAWNTIAHSETTGQTATDHHVAPAAGPDAAITTDTGSAAGTASTFARSGHGHNITVLTTKGDIFTYSTLPLRLGVGSNTQVLTADSTTATGLKWATPSSGGSVATDVIWDAAGDLALGTGADTAARLAITVPAANILNVLGVVNGETTASWKAVHDGTAPIIQAFGDIAAAGFALTAAHRDHKHGMPAATVTKTRWLPSDSGGNQTLISTATKNIIGTAPDSQVTTLLPDAASTGNMWEIEVPWDWSTGAITYVLYWSPGSTDAVAHTIAWSTDVLELIPGSATDVTAAGTTTAWTGGSAARTANLIYVEASQTLLTPTAAGNLIRATFRRIGGDAADTYVGVVRLHGVLLSYTATR